MLGMGGGGIQHRQLVMGAIPSGSSRHPPFVSLDKALAQVREDTLVIENLTKGQGKIFPLTLPKPLDLHPLPIAYSEACFGTVVCYGGEKDRIGLLEKSYFLVVDREGALLRF